MKWSEIKGKPREIDKLISEEVFGEEVRTDKDGEYGMASVLQGEPTFLRCYSGTISAAWLVAERLKDKGFLIILAASKESSEDLADYFCEVLNDEMHESSNYIQIWADTAPLAICHAALLAMGALENEGEDL